MREPKKRRSETAADRTTRLLSLVSYLTLHDSATIDELARHFEVSEKQIVSDINLLWVTGTPGYMSDDLIDFDAFALEQGVVRLTASRGLGATLRLGSKESIALLAALNSLRDFVDHTESGDLLERLIKKLSLSLGGLSASLDVQLAQNLDAEKISALRSAIQDATVVTFEYVDANDSVSHRVVEPWSLFTENGITYLKGFCRSARNERVFRLDRTGAISVEPTESFTHPKGALAGQAAIPTTGNEVTLIIEPSGRWIAEEIPALRSSEDSEGRIALTIDVARPQWLIHLLTAHADVISAVSPASYAHTIRDRAKTALKMYENVGSSYNSHSAPQGDPR